MSIRVGINGFGRMGRLALRAAWGGADLEIVHVNETSGGAATAAHLLEFDSVHGRFARRIEAHERAISIDGKSVSFTEHAAPGEVPWRDLGVNLVLECTGKFRTTALLNPYFQAGVKKVIVAAPVKEGALNVVMGVNDDLYRPDEHHLLTAASCTTNCLAPVVKVVHEGIGIRHGVITTIHDITNTQTVVDAPHKDLRRARASSLSLIPTSTGSATAITLIYPELKGKLNGLAGFGHNGFLMICRARPAPQRLAHLLCLRGRAADDGGGGERAHEGGGGRSARGDPRVRDSPPRLRRLQGRSAIGHHRRSVDHGGRRHQREDPRLVRQRDRVREPDGGARAQGRAGPRLIR